MLKSFSKSIFVLLIVFLFIDVYYILPIKRFETFARLSLILSIIYFSFYIFVFKKQVKILFIDFTFLILFLYMFFNNFIIGLPERKLTTGWYLVIFGFLYFSLSESILNIPKKDLTKTLFISIIFISFSTLLLCLDYANIFGLGSLRLVRSYSVVPYHVFDNYIRLNSFIQDPNLLGMFLLPLFIITFSDSIINGSLYCLIASLILSLMIFLTFSRGAIISLCVGTILLLVFTKRKSIFKLVSVITLLCICLFINLYWPGGFNRLSEVTSLELEENTGRLDIWSMTLHSFDINKVFFGMGANSFILKIGMYIHNAYLDLLYNYGFIGFALFALIVYLTFVSIHSIHDKNERILFYSLFISLYIGYFFIHDIFRFSFIFCLAFIRSERLRVKQDNVIYDHKKIKTILTESQ